MTATPEQIRQAWPQQLRLPGQADAPEGPVDLSVMYLMHHAFRRDLAAFAHVVPRTPLTELAAWRALLRRWDVFSEMLLHHHHGEDTWPWPALLEKADPTERETLVAMEAEHAEIDPLLVSCLGGLRMLAGGHATADDRAALAVRLAAARESLGRHLAHEERDALRILQRRIMPEEWSAIDAHFVEDLTNRQLLALVPWLLHGVPGETRRRVLAGAGLPQRIVSFAGAIAATPEMGAQGHADAVRLTGALAPYANGRRYLTFAENPVDTRTAYGEDVWTQLKGIRSAVDPHGIFAANHPVPRLFEDGRVTDRR